MKTEEQKQNEIYKSRWAILLIIVLSIFMSALDDSIVNAALPTMSTSLGVSLSLIAWVVSIYLITISATMHYLEGLEIYLVRQQSFSMV